MATLTTRRIMGTVLLSLLPGLGALCYFNGPGYLPRLACAAALALTLEAALLRLRGRQPTVLPGDFSALVTATLLVLALPPGVPYPALLLAVSAALLIGKHLYGGLGSNPFHPAVVGYAMTLVCFPTALALWPSALDGTTGATALTSFRHREGLTVADVWRPEFGFGSFGALGWEWINMAFLAGGLVLVALRIAAWRVPAGMLGCLCLLAMLGYDSGSSSSLGSPLMHCFTGSTMLAAFYFATDPVTHPASRRGQWLFGAVIGAMTFVVRSFGNYPDGIAFGILLANGATPWLDRRWVTARE
ncbi:MAG: RnfABCDGE type electron transport complex subunit D [Pseudomonadales bacterium]